MATDKEFEEIGRAAVAYVAASIELERLENTIQSAMSAYSKTAQRLLESRDINDFKIEENLNLLNAEELVQLLAAAAIAKTEKSDRRQTRDCLTAKAHFGF